MNFKTVVSLFSILLLSTGVSAQQMFVASGMITDERSHQPIDAATVAVLGSSFGTLTDSLGAFTLQIDSKLPFTLEISALGYEQQHFLITSENINTSLSLALHPSQVAMDQVVVSASRIPERILSAPVSIEKLDVRAIRSGAAPTFYDMLENVKGIQMTTLSLGYKVPNARGFSGTTNSRFLQMVDGVDNTSPGIGAPVGNAVGPTELDIESMEIIPGASSALYGLNAVSGIANLKTKSPYDYQGLSVYQRVGINHVDDAQHKVSPLSETALRYACALGAHFAFKVNAAYTRGNDWIADNLRDQNPDANSSTGLTGADNPGKDLVNVYGDESSDRQTLTLNGKKYVVSRTGYRESDLADYNLNNYKVDVSLHYRFQPGKELSYVYRIGNVRNLYQRGNRIELDGLQIQQHVLEYKTPRYFVKAYYTMENTGSSYNLRPLGENLDQAFKDNKAWFGDYTNAYNAAISQGLGDAGAHRQARATADAGRFEPGTEAFEQEKAKLIAINNWDIGAALKMTTSLAHVEGQYDFSDYTPGFQVLAGFNYRNYFIKPDGNSFVNPKSFTDEAFSNAVFNYYSAGGFVQVTKKILEEKLKIVASLRADKVQYFGPKLNPRIALVLSPAKDHNFRISYQNGYRFPTLFEGFSYVDNGGVKRLGGLQVMSEHFGVFENAYLRSSQDKFIAAVNKDVNSGGMSLTEAQDKNSGILVKSQYGYIKPEYINSLEAGYKGVFADGKIFIDIDYYFNVYRDFIGQVELTRPNEGIIGQDAGTVNAAYDKTQSKIYRMWTNSTGTVSNHGAGLGGSYNFYRKFSLNANVSYARLLKVSATDGLIPAFNTPEWMVNIAIGNREVWRNTGFSINYRYQSTFDWESPLANGRIPAYGVVDAQITYRLPRLFTTLKLGASNLFNKRYYQYEGGPVIGGLYYFTVIFDLSKS
ncbi:TonB-dependent receptor [Taibaiella koreensis]|uniref:TonB-dependent receptor n=1 Tax=Taibaiella koreensis TaxID=1268548 RepID=UPI000E59E61B|nr:TonB-dependent receptor [Taibaiella koreensis]